MAATTNTTIDSVTAYYGKVLSKTEDLKTNACTTGSAPPAHIKALLRNIHHAVLAKYYGCGLCIPVALKGLTVLDLGCGSGRDCYIAAQLVGEGGRVIGLDMTDEQLETAASVIEWQRDTFGYKVANTEFKKGFMERLHETGIPANSVDVIISNCVVNLSPDKRAVLKGAFDLLKVGGELYFSDVYATRRMPARLQEDEVLWGECISGAMYWHDFLTVAKECGFGDPRLVEDSEITVNNPLLQEKLGEARFFSATYRLFKLPALESACEDYGQAVVYRGGAGDGMEHAFTLDSHHRMEKGKVCLWGRGCVRVINRN